MQNLCQDETQTPRPLLFAQFKRGEVSMGLLWWTWWSTMVVRRRLDPAVAVTEAADGELAAGGSNNALPKP